MGNAIVIERRHLVGGLTSTVCEPNAVMQIVVAHEALFVYMYCSHLAKTQDIATGAGIEATYPRSPRSPRINPACLASDCSKFVVGDESFRIANHNGHIGLHGN